MKKIGKTHWNNIGSGKTEITFKAENQEKQKSTFKAENQEKQKSTFKAENLEKQNKNNFKAENLEEEKTLSKQGIKKTESNFF